MSLMAVKPTLIYSNYILNEIHLYNITTITTTNTTTVITNTRFAELWIKSNMKMCSWRETKEVEEEEEETTHKDIFDES